MGILVLSIGFIYSFVCFLKIRIFFKEYKSFVLQNKCKLYLAGICEPIALLTYGIL